MERLMIVAFILFTIGVFVWLHGVGTFSVGSVVAGLVTMAAGAGAIIVIGVWALL
jgi:hypothetical protein